MKSFDEWFDKEYSNYGNSYKKTYDAIYDLQHIESAMWEEQVEHVLMILKGNKDEN